MGVVYRATDTRLDREVAIKALPDDLATDPSRLERFEREARTLAQLNHPNLAGIHGLEEFDGAKYLVLEFVEGVTLADRLDAGPLPPDEAVEIAAQIADGVAAAHDAGIVHRDLKPANVIITPDGRAKVLDFGLARADDGQSTTGSSEAVTLTTPRHSPTVPGVVLGTAAYMSPEQARGRRVDKRTDIWSFGVILYEMLTGASPFVGETASDSIGAVLHKSFDLSLLPPQTPAGARRVLERCLERDRNLRCRDIGDARLELLRGQDGPAQEPATVTGLPLWLLPLAGLAMIAVAAAVWVAKPAPKPAPGPLRKLEILVENLHRDQNHAPVISPDGARVLYIANGSIWVRTLSDLDAVQLAGTEGATHPFWSPDSSQIGFQENSRLWRMPATGGARSMICVTPRPLEVAGGVTWAPDNTVVFTAAWGGPIWAAPVSGGEPIPILTPDPKVIQDFHDASALPDGSGILTVAHFAVGLPDAIGLVHDGTCDILVQHPGEELWKPVYADGYILYGRQQSTGSIWAAPFSLETRKVTGPSVLVAESADIPSASTDGTLIFVASSFVGTGELAWVDRTGALLESIGGPQSGVSWPMPSPNDDYAGTLATETGTSQIWIHDLARGTRRRVASDTGSRWVVGWTDDNRLVYCGGNPLKTYAVSLTGAGVPQLIVEGEAAAVSFDGRYILSDKRVGHSLDIFIYDTKEGGLARPLLASSATETDPAISPDGRWLAYTSDESGRDEIYLTRFPSGEGSWQVSSGGGTQARWTLDSGTLFYQTGRTDDTDVMSVRVVTEPELRLSEPTRLFTGTDSPINLEKGWSPSADGQRILGIRDVTSKFETDRIVVVENWSRAFESTGNR